MAVIALLAACLHPVPPVFSAAPARLDVPARDGYRDEPGGCPGVVVEPGWVADCSGIAISLAGSEYVELLEADLALARVYLAESQALAALERAHVERAHAETWTRARVAERDARVLRLAVPVAFAGGLVLGGAAAIGVLAAAEVTVR